MSVATGVYIEAYITIHSGIKTLYKGYGNVKWDSSEGYYYWEVYLGNNGNSLQFNSQERKFGTRKECTNNMFETFKQDVRIGQ